jgi:hypothetical protein
VTECGGGGSSSLLVIVVERRSIVDEDPNRLCIWYTGVYGFMYELGYEFAGLLRPNSAFNKIRVSHFCSQNYPLCYLHPLEERNPNCFKTAAWDMLN